MKRHKRDQDFLRLPTYPGGKKAYQQFIHENLRYPDEALQAKAEGKVHVSFEVNDNGEVVSAVVTKGMGYGCDEEALRIVRMLRYDKVKNRGMRVKSTVKTTIEFRLSPAPLQGMNYQYVVKTKAAVEKTSEPATGQVYNYTIKIN